MGVINSALDIITEQLCEKFGSDIEVKDHPGRFTDDELGRILRKPKAIRVAVEQLPELKVEADGIRGATARFIVFVLCSDTKGEDRHRAALDIVEELAAFVVYNRWGRPDMFQAVSPSTIAAENLYSGEISTGKGLAWWALTWTQVIHRR